MIKETVERHVGHRCGLWVSMVLVGAIVGRPAYLSWHQGWILNQEDTRLVAKRWMEAHIPRGARLAVEHYTPPISREEYEVWVFKAPGELKRDRLTRGYKASLGTLITTAPFDAKRIDYVVLSNYLERVEAAAPAHEGERQFYREVFARGRLLYEIRADPRRRPGPTIRVLRWRGAESVSERGGHMAGGTDNKGREPLSNKE